MVILITIILWLYILWYSLRKRHYYFALLYFWVGIYENVGQLYFAFFEDFNFGVNVQRIIEPYVTESVLINYRLVLIGFFLFMAIIYFLMDKYDKCPSSPIIIKSTVSDFNFLFFGVILFGIIAVATNAGSVRQLDYLSNIYRDTKENPALPYGQHLLVCAVGLLWYSILNRRWWYALIIALSIAPITFELFIAGRRQVFMPSVLLVLMLVLYNNTIKNKRRVVIVLSLAISAFTAYQFSNRTGSIEFDPIQIIFQFSELLLIHATSLVSFSVVDVNSISFGQIYVVDLLNSFPYFRLGDFILNAFGKKPWSYDSETVTPMGGLSMIADSILAFHVFGPFILAFFMAAIAHFYHRRFRIYTQYSSFANFNAMLILPIGVIFVMNYRNGFSHLIKGVVSFCLIYIFFTYLSQFIKRLLFVRKK